MRTLTAANAVFSIFAPGLFPVPHVLQGFATDDAFDSEQREIAEAQMGVDAKMSAGYLPNITKQTVVLQADSTSIDFIEQLVGAMEQQQEIFFLSATIVMQGQAKAYALTKGVLTKTKAIPGAKKLVQPNTYEFAWERVQPLQIGL